MTALALENGQTIRGLWGMAAPHVTATREWLSENVASFFHTNTRQSDVRHEADARVAADGASGAAQHFANQRSFDLHANFLAVLKSITQKVSDVWRPASPRPAVGDRKAKVA
jgi:hypothetical protein